MLVAGTAGILDPRSYVPLLFLACLLWVLLTSVVLTSRVGRRVGATLPAEAVPAGVDAGR